MSQYEDLIQSFFSRPDQGETAALIIDTYSLLIRQVRLTSQVDGELLNAAQEAASSNRNNDLKPACQLFHYVQWGYQSAPNRLYGDYLIQQIFHSMDFAKKTGKSEQEVQNLVGLFFEFRACCLALLAQRNLLSHKNTPISFAQALFLCACVTRTFEIAQTLHAHLQERFSHEAALEKYRTRLQRLSCRAQEGQGEIPDLTRSLQDMGGQIELLRNRIEENTRDLKAAIREERARILAALATAAD